MIPSRYVPVLTLAAATLTAAITVFLWRLGPGWGYLGMGSALLGMLLTPGALLASFWVGELHPLLAEHPCRGLVYLDLLFLIPAWFFQTFMVVIWIAFLLKPPGLF